MKEIDVRGLACPEPILLTKEALKKESSVKVICEPHQKANIEGVATLQGKTATATKVGNDYEVVIE
ncbi:MAG TPA: sulfurtransferase TusA family protein [Haloplasmataceae bacterium]